MVYEDRYAIRIKKHPAVITSPFQQTLRVTSPRLIKEQHQNSARNSRALFLIRYKLYNFLRTRKRKSGKRFCFVYWPLLLAFAWGRVDICFKKKKIINKPDCERHWGLCRNKIQWRLRLQNGIPCEPVRDKRSRNCSGPHHRTSGNDWVSTPERPLRIVEH
jgi:hypothetical protein